MFENFKVNHNFYIYIVRLHTYMYTKKIKRHYKQLYDLINMIRIENDIIVMESHLKINKNKNRINSSKT